MKSARLLITLACGRGCEYCANKYPHIRKHMQKLEDVAQLADYDMICLSGGEPFLRPVRFQHTVEALYGQNEKQKLYVYTSLAHPVLRVALPFLDGVTYTVHRNYDKKDIWGLVEVQNILEGDGGEHRLNLSPDIMEPLPIKPSVWSSIKIKTWRDVGDPLLCLPEDDMYVMGNFNS